MNSENPRIVAKGREMKADARMGRQASRPRSKTAVERANAKAREDAVRDYINETEGLFNKVSGEDGKGRMQIDVLNERITGLVSELQQERCRSFPFSGRERSLLATALVCPGQISYRRYRIVGRKCECETIREECREAKARNAIVYGLSAYCRRAAVLADHIGSSAREGFKAAMLKLDWFAGDASHAHHDRSFLNVNALVLMDRIQRESGNLWADLAIAAEKRPTVPLGPYVRTVVEICYADTQEIVFRNTAHTRLRVERGSHDAWEIVLALLKTDDPDGYADILSIKKDWSKAFKRPDKQRSDLPTLRRYIVNDGRRRGLHRLVANPV